MTREECIALLDRYANYNGMGIPNLAGCGEAMRKAVELLSAKPSEDLTEEVRKVLTDDAFHIRIEEGDFKTTILDYKKIASHFYELGKQAMKEQMFKYAVEGVAEELYNDGEIHCTVGVGTYFKPGDDVYVIKK